MGLFWMPKLPSFSIIRNTYAYTDSAPPKCPSFKGCFAPGCSRMEALLGSPAPEYGVRWNGKSQWRWNLFCRENTAGYRSICRLLYIYIYTYYRSACAYLEFALLCRLFQFQDEIWNTLACTIMEVQQDLFVKEGVLVLEGPILLCHDYGEEI